MEVTGKIIVALPEMSGTSKMGNPWKKREYVLETIESFPKKIHFDFFGEKADQFVLNPGDTIRLSFDIESREYNGRWYTSIRGWKAEPATEGAPAPGQAIPRSTLIPAARSRIWRSTPGSRLWSTPGCPRRFPHSHSSCSR